MQIVIIDGFHRGHVLDWHDPQPEIRLVKPKTITQCDCNPAGIEEFPSDEDIITYKCAFRSIDGRVALFSTTGESMRFLVDGGFIHHFQKEPWHKGTVLYFGCHDQGSWS